MNSPDKGFTPYKTLGQRLSSAGFGLLALVAACVTPFYGVIFITNGLTQIQHLDLWSYVSIMVACYSLLGVLITLMVKLMLKHWQQAWT